MLPSPGAVFQPDRVLDDYGQVLAAVMPFQPQQKRTGFLSKLRGQTSASEAIRKADEEGPGIVGFYLDLKADVTALVDYRIQRWDRVALEWTWDDHPAASSALATDLLGVNGERIDEFARHFAREMEAVGEVGFAPVEMDGMVRYRTLSLDPGSFEITEKNKDGTAKMLGFKGTRAAKRPAKGQESHDWIEIPADSVIRILRPHPRWFAEPYTPLARALGDVRRYENATRALHRAVASQLINSGLLWFQGSHKDLVQPNANSGRNGRVNGQQRLGFLGQQIQGLMDAGERALTDYDETQVQSAMFHPIVSEEAPPQFINIGETVDPNLLDLKRDALEDFARDVNIPMSVLVEGQGAAQRLLNEWLQDKSFKQTSIMPDARRVGAGLTVAFLHPRLQRLAEREPRLFLQDGQQIPVTDFRIYPDEASITQDEPEIDDIKHAVECGILSPEALIDALDGHRFRLDRPEGITDWDWWRMYHAESKNSDEVESPSPQATTASVWSQPWSSQ